MRHSILNQRRQGDEPKRQAVAPPGSGVEPATTAPPPGQRQEGTPLLLRVNELSQLLGVSERSIWRMQSAGKLPAAVRLAGSIRWRRDEIENWVAAGCPAINNPR